MFDDRTQEVIIHDPLLRSKLPKQEPDRVYGLQETNNFEKLLSTPVPNALANDANVTLRELVRNSPFKDGVEPLLFPFLILEAKSGKSSSGFYEIQTQTAFPIFALLKLQEDLLAQVQDGGVANGPLIWFFANRGDAWRVYGCCLSDSEPTRYVRILSNSFYHGILDQNKYSSQRGGLFFILDARLKFQVPNSRFLKNSPIYLVIRRYDVDSY